MALKEKYAKLIELAQTSGAQDLSVTEQNNVLYVSASTTESVKDELWNIYDQIDPNMRAADLVLDIKVIPGTEKKEEIYEVKSGDSLSKIATKFPGVTWKQIFDANTDQLKDPNKIFPGQKLRIPKK